MTHPTPPPLSADPATLAELLERAARGDQDAFARLYDDTVPRVYGLVLRVVRDPALAEDVTRRVFVGAWLQAGHYDASRASVLAWLTTAAHRCAVDAARAAEATSASPGACAVDVTALSAASARAEAAFDSLEPAEREALYLTWGVGYTHREVATLLGVQPDVVPRLVRTGLLRLGRELAVA